MDFTAKNLKIKALAFLAIFNVEFCEKGQNQSDNPDHNEIQQHPMHLEIGTFWCGICAAGVPYYFENDEVQAITVNGKRLRLMIAIF